MSASCSAPLCRWCMGKPCKGEMHQQHAQHLKNSYTAAAACKLVRSLEEAAARPVGR